MSMKLTTKQLRPKAADTKWLGNEPTWEKQPEDQVRQSETGRAFNWYNYYYTRTEAKLMLIQYLEINERPDEVKLVSKVNDKYIMNAMGWWARMTVMGFKQTEAEKTKLETYISGLIEKVKADKESKKAEVQEKTTVPKPNIQDHLREKVYECCGEIDGMFDDFIDHGATKQSLDKFSPLDQMRRMNISPNMVSLIVRAWEPQIEEFKETLEGKCPQLVEGYRHVTKAQMKNWIKFGEKVIADTESYVQIKKVEKKPRRVRAVSPEKLSRKFKYLKQFEELNIKSESPVKLVNGTEAWLYNTKTRKLIHLVADSLAKSYSVKGASVIGFDPRQTVQKTLRKPKEQLKELMSAGKPASRKIFEGIKATEIKFNGRSNENLMILKAW